MAKRIYISAAIVLIFGLLALLAFNFFEIHEGVTISPPSREALTNDYLALEKWLEESGSSMKIFHAAYGSYNPARVISIPEKTLIIYAASCKWENAKEYFIPWIENGGSLIICIDYGLHEEINENLLMFLSSFGIQIEETYPAGDYWKEEIPNFDWNIGFNIDNNIYNKDKVSDIKTSSISKINDNLGVSRLAELIIGEGTLTVTGLPRFMSNYYLSNEINARLAWRLTGERALKKGSGVLFIVTGNYSKSFFRKISERGNITPLLISVLITVFTGFWMVIPVFGLVFDEKQKISLPIRERFKAEIGFLKKHKALKYYLEVYEKENNNNEIIEKLRGIINGKRKN